MNKLLRNIFYIFLPIVLGSLVGIIISKYMDYSQLIKPPLAPPKIFFPIAWSIIYLLMGISYYLFRKKINLKYSFEVKIYYLQLIVNLLWSIIFFIFKWRFIAILWILFLDYLVIYMIKLFKNKVPLSAYLNYFYLAWIIFASYLTIGIYILN